MTSPCCCTELPAFDTFLLRLPQCHGVYAHPSHIAGIRTADQCGSKSPKVCHDGHRCCLWPLQRLESDCVFLMEALQSEASGESHSKRPNRRDRRWKLFFFYLCKHHTAHHQVQQRCRQHFDWLSSCVPPTDHPGVCSSSEQALGRKSACTEGSCTLFPRCYLYPRRYWGTSYSNCVHRQ